jgi:hypothetical protein
VCSLASVQASLWRPSFCTAFPLQLRNRYLTHIRDK